MDGGDTDEVGILDETFRDGWIAVGVLLLDDPFLPPLKDDSVGGGLVSAEAIKGCDRFS